MFVADVIAQSRARLGDEAKHRWTDDRLVYIANQGQKAICKLSGIIRREAVIPLSQGILSYRLPPDCATLKRIEYKGEYLPLYTRNDNDANRPYKEEMVALKTNLSMGFLELYPAIPEFTGEVITIVQGLPTDNIFTVVPLYGVVTNGDLPFQVIDTFGEVTNIEYDMTLLSNSSNYGEVMDSSICTPISISYSTGVFGVVTGAEYTAPVTNLFGIVTDTNSIDYAISGSFGITTDVVSSESYLKIFYESVPTAKMVYTSSFIIPDVWEEAMLRYIVGTALQDDNDASNVQRGELELTKFTNEVLKAREMSSKDFSSGIKEKLTTSFRRI